MPISKCEKWIYDYHRTILWTLFILSMYYVCILKLKSNIESNDPPTFFAFFGKKNSRSHLVDSTSPQQGSFNRIYEALRGIPVFRKHEDDGRKNLMTAPAMSSHQLGLVPVSIGYESPGTSTQEKKGGQGFVQNAFDKLIRFLTPSRVQCRIKAPSIANKDIFFGTTDGQNEIDQDCFVQTKCEMLANVVEKKRCLALRNHAYNSHSAQKHIQPRLSASSVLSRFIPERVSNIFLDRMGHSMKPSGRRIDLYIDESLSFLNKIKELRAAQEREMELNLHLNFSGLNTFRKHGIIEQFLQSAAAAIQPRVLVRCSLPPAALVRLLHTETLGSSAAVVLKTKWERRSPEIENGSFRSDYFNNLH